MQFSELFDAIPDSDAKAKVRATMADLDALGGDLDTAGRAELVGMPNPGSFAIRTLKALIRLVRSLPKSTDENVPVTLAQILGPTAIDTTTPAGLARVKALDFAYTQVMAEPKPTMEQAEREFMAMMPSIGQNFWAVANHTIR